MNSLHFLAVTCEAPLLQNRAAELARTLRLPLVDAAEAENYDHLLVLTARRLELRKSPPNGMGPVYVDFLTGPLKYRRRFGGGRGQPLARAIGLKGGINPLVLDATAGLGRDGFVLAGLGCTVHLVERSPVIAALVRDALERAARDPEIGPWVRERMSLTVADSRLYMKDLDNCRRPDVVYLDPMYPRRTKSALVKKEMRFLRAIVGEDPDASGLLAAALPCARRRVVVKRSRQAPPLEGPEPALSIQTPNTRFDVYWVSGSEIT